MLYACFVLKNKLIKKIQKEHSGRAERSYAEEVFDLVKQNMTRIINIHQVNNTPSLKNYSSMFDKSKARKLFKENNPHITFVREEESAHDKYKDEVKTREDRVDRSQSNSRSK
jgi:hypothetical protein